MHSTNIRWWLTLGCGLLAGVLCFAGVAFAVDDELSDEDEVPAAEAPAAEAPLTSDEKPAPPLTEPGTRKPKKEAAPDADADQASSPAKEQESAPPADAPTPDAARKQASEGDAAKKAETKVDAKGPPDESIDADTIGDAPAPAATAEAGKPQELPPAPNKSLTATNDKTATAAARPETAAFRRVAPGKSTAAEVEKAWGASASRLRQKDIVRQTYRMDEFEHVEVRFYRDRVQSIVLKLKKYAPLVELKELSAELALDKCSPVDVSDEFGEALGAAYPERGVALVFDPEHRDRRVAQVIIEPIDPHAFLLRAENRLLNDYTGCQQDLDVALLIDSQMARGWWLRARLLRTIGQADAATKAVQEAVRLEPRNPEFRLTYAALLADKGQSSRAIQEIRATLPMCAARPALKAKVLNQLGDQIAAGPGQEFETALKLHIQAIKLAEPRLDDRRIAVRRMAQDALIAAHLSAARDIAWGKWQKKDKIVPVWLKRAQELAQEAAIRGPSSDNTMLVCRDALTACVGMEGIVDPTPWVEKALECTSTALANAKDPLRRRCLEWELGCALYDSLQVYHLQGEQERAIKYGTLAVEHLEAGSKDREIDTAEAFLLGRLYFRMGSVYAMHAKDADKAVVWYERAIPLLERPIPTAAQADAGQHGESFVSMAVSYWAAGSREEAMRLTRQGLKLMQAAVKDGNLEEAALKVPYTNLATMHRFLGDDEQADAFSEMASKATTQKR